MEERYPDWRAGFAVCPKCRGRTRITVQVIQHEKFLPTDSDNIEASFLKHHVVSGVPMTSNEIQVLHIALNVHGFRTMRHVSHCIFVAAIPFRFPLPKEKLRLGRYHGASLTGIDLEGGHRGTGTGRACNEMDEGMPFTILWITSWESAWRMKACRRATWW